MKKKKLRKRTCGGCTACCLTHEIHELQKPNWQLCQHCVTGFGCRIYSKRPRSCQLFKCQWLLGAGEKKDRPDKTGIVLDYAPQESDVSILMMWEAVPNALHSSYAVRLRTAVLSNGMLVCFMYRSGEREVFLPPNFELTDDVREAIVEGGGHITFTRQRSGLEV